ncbi:MAG: UDP-glucose 4-epimerase GalE [Nevskiaceae bacterium]|nr:MAG: UDP-glucose 4-epimerase GalE [Nevskiaceae bacterium]TBR72215.1 MAG: UDP-glucose 4-epimerase GalE [Nevskiaceae bacterium]
MKVFVCGGAGYIGSHTCVELAAAGHELLIYDNFCNSSRTVLARLAELIGHPVAVAEGDVRDAAALTAALRAFAPQVVIHFAALKAVGESVAQPLVYFDNNITGSIVLLQAMRTCGVPGLVFSSSATVYGTPDHCPIAETAALGVTNPYGRTKLVVEQLIADTTAAHPRLHAVVLRYFNPVGAHASGCIGEDPHDTPNNLMPYVSQVAVGRRPHLNVFGNDYPTPDGTGVRDYIHVVDLARAHVAAVGWLGRNVRNLTVNVGTGHGYSVLDVVAAFEKASGRKVPVSFAPRRPGDVAECYADPTLAGRELGWHAEYGLERMCADAWRWQHANPNGYTG